MAGNATLVDSLTANGSTVHRLVTRKRYNMSVWGTFDATVVLERSFDEGSTWLEAKSVTTPFEGVGIETEAQVWYRFTVSSFVSGTINVRLGLTTL